MIAFAGHRSDRSGRINASKAVTADSAFAAFVVGTKV
jgi:hypothetical protein